MREYVPKKEIRVSSHASERIKGRMGIKRSAAHRIAMIAWDKGLTHKECTGPLEDLVTAMFSKSQTANNIRVYAQKVFLFANETLITVIPL